MPKTYLSILPALLFLFLSPCGALQASDVNPRDELRDVLERREFQDRFQGEGINPEMPDLEKYEGAFDQIKNIFEKIQDNLGGMIRKFFGIDGPGNRRGFFRGAGGSSIATISQIVVWVVIGLIIIVFVILILRMISESRKPAATAQVAGFASLDHAAKTENALDYGAEQWQRFAQEWSQQGDFRMALRAVYLSLLVELHRQRCIVYDKNKTNWEYVGEFKAKMNDSPAAFRDLTRIFDFKWYGEISVNEEEYGHYQSLALTLSKENAGARVG